MGFSVVLVAGDPGGAGYLHPFQGQVYEVVEQAPRLPHFLLRRPVLSVEFFLSLRQLPALLFQRVHPGELGPVQNVIDRRLCRPIGSQGLLMLRQILLSKVAGQYDWTMEDLVRLQYNAIQAAFCTEEEKDRLREQLRLFEASL